MLWFYVLSCLFFCGLVLWFCITVYFVWIGLCDDDRSLMRHAKLIYMHLMIQFCLSVFLLFMVWIVHSFKFTQIAWNHYYQRHWMGKMCQYLHTVQLVLVRTQFRTSFKQYVLGILAGFQYWFLLIFNHKFSCTCLK